MSAQLERLRLLERELELERKLLWNSTGDGGWN